MKGYVDSIINNVHSDVITVFGLKPLCGVAFATVEVETVGSFFEPSERLLRGFGFNNEADWLVSNVSRLEDCFLFTTDVPSQLISQYVNDLFFLHVRLAGSVNSGLSDVSLKSLFPFWKVEGETFIEQVFFTAFNNSRVSETIFSETLTPSLGFRNSGMLTFPETVLQNYHHMLMISLKIAKNDIKLPFEKVPRSVHMRRLEEYCSEEINIFDCNEETLKLGKFPFLKTPTMLSTLYYSDIPVQQWGALVGLPEEWVKTLGS